MKPKLKMYTFIHICLKHIAFISEANLNAIQVTQKSFTHDQSHRSHSSSAFRPSWQSPKQKVA